MRIRAYGDTALLLDCASLHEAQAWFAALHGQAEVVLGARTVLVRGDPSRLRQMLSGMSPSAPASAAPQPTVDLPVTYDGPDLDVVCGQTGLTRAEVIHAHTATPWTVAFGGFAPGFSYLIGGDPRLQVARRDSPRTLVPAGSVGLAGEFSGVYPRSSPGGWQIIGSTNIRVWESNREPPALLVAGARVRFVPA